MIAVVLQPMYFPWSGVFDQIRLADTYVHYDDVQMPRGRSFTSRVQIKQPQGAIWLTVPVRRGGDQLIKDVITDESTRWRQKHLATLSHAFAKCPHRDDALDIASEVLKKSGDSLSEINIMAIELISNYMGLKCIFTRSSEIQCGGKSTGRLVAICEKLQADVYITGHGAKSYLNHESFEDKGIKVEYMSYQLKEHPQQHGPFTPYVSSLDLIANMGRDGVGCLGGSTISWRSFIND